MKILPLYRSMLRENDGLNPITTPINFGNWKMSVDKYNRIINNWTGYYGSVEDAESNFWAYQNDVINLWNNGGTLYRILWLDDIEKFNKADIGGSWTVSSNAIDTITSGLWYGTDAVSKSTKPFIISAKTPPHNVDVQYVDIAGNAEEEEIHIIDQSKLTDVMIKPYRNN